jgi:hypothetical protein
VRKSSPDSLSAKRSKRVGVAPQSAPCWSLTIPSQDLPEMRTILHRGDTSHHVNCPCTLVYEKSVVESRVLAI